MPEVRCPSCKHVWNYKGARKYTNCPICRRQVNVERNLLAAGHDTLDDKEFLDLRQLLTAFDDDARSDFTMFLRGVIELVRDKRLVFDGATAPPSVLIAALEQVPRHFSLREVVRAFQSMSEPQRLRLDEIITQAVYLIETGQMEQVKEGKQKTGATEEHVGVGYPLTMELSELMADREIPVTDREAFLKLLSTIVKRWRWERKRTKHPITITALEHWEEMLGSPDNP